MADTAAHLVDCVLPEVPVRQWVLTLPYPLRYRCAYDARLTSAVLRAFLRALFAELRRRARQQGSAPRGQCGAVTFIQRFGSALNANLHFHTLVLDGVYASTERQPTHFLPLPPPSHHDVARVLAGTARRITRLLASRAEGDDDALARDEPLLATLASASLRTRIATGPHAGERWRRLGDRVERAHLTLQDRLVKELRLREIRDVEAANAFAPEFMADYNRRFARAPRSEHDAHRPLQSSDDLARVFSWQELRFVSKSLPLNYKRVLYVLDPTEAARAARSKAVGIEEREDGSLRFWHGEHELLATAFPKEHRVQQGEVVENKRLSVALDFIKEQQRERIEAKVAKPSTTRRDARLLRAGTPRRAAMGSSAETRP